jgi:hypothetical protein
MKTISFFFLIISGSFWNFPHSKLATMQAHSNYVSIADAEKILGEPARLADSSKEIKGPVTKYNYSYSALASDPKTNATGNLYYTLSQYQNAAAAQKAYAAVINSNRDMPGLDKLTDVGDEAFFHTDNQHFCLIMFRKQNLIFVVKVNRITSKTSVKELKMIAANLAKN